MSGICMSHTLGRSLDTNSFFFSGRWLGRVYVSQPWRIMHVFELAPKFYNLKWRADYLICAWTIV